MGKTHAGKIVLQQDLNPHLSKTNSRDIYIMEFIREFWAFLSIRKKLWLAPIIIVMLVLGGLIILTEGTVVAPFVYTLF
jgi:hypothetical protein